MARNKQYWTNLLGEDWTKALEPLLRDPYANKLMDFIDIEYALGTILPIKPNIFQSFIHCPLKSIKVVILVDAPQFNCSYTEQGYSDLYIDGYHNGSLPFIRECVETEYGPSPGFDYSLEGWLKQGVFILHSSLTTNAKNPKAHFKPWKKFIDYPLKTIVENHQDVLFVLWGNDEFIDKYKYLKFDLNYFVCSWEHPHSAVMEFRKWNCPNFKEIDKRLFELYGKEVVIDWKK